LPIQWINSLPASSAGGRSVHGGSAKHQQRKHLLQDDINNFQTNTIDPLQKQLQSEYSQAEIALQQLPGELKDVTPNWA